MVPIESAPISRAMLRRPRVLLVDDDPVVVRALWRMLRQCRPNFQINTAASPSQALDALSELTYDVVITDLQMPEGGGAAVLRTLYESYPETARIIHSSQLESSDTAPLCASAHAVLAKPASEAQLLEAIERALQSVARASSACSAC